MITDCFLVGNNSKDITETLVWYKYNQISKDSLEYQVLLNNLVRYHNKYYTKRELFNLFFMEENNKIEAQTIAMKNILNTTIAYLANFLNKNKLTFQYINEFNSQKEDLKRALLDKTIHCVAITSTYYTETFPLKEVIDYVKKFDDKIKIIIGGAYILSLNAMDEVSLQRELKYIGADYYICSTEGEQALVQLVQAAKENRSVHDINNIYYWNGNDFEFTRDIPEYNRFEDEIIDWSLFDPAKLSFVNIRSSKSCPFSCSFCTEKKISGSFKQASLDTVEAMLNEVNKIDKKVSVMFLDDTLNIPPKRFKEMLRKMITNQYKFKWFCFVRSQYLDDEMCSLMKESGCESVLVGVESGNQKVLDIMNKQVKLEQLSRGIELLNKYDIISTASLIIGYPGETYETFLDTKRFIEETKPTFYRANPWNCNPLSPIFNRKDEFEIVGENRKWSHKTMDSEMAYQLTNELYLTVKNSINVTDLEFDTTFTNHMLYRDLSLEQIKAYHVLFNTAIYEKISNKTNNNISKETEEKMREVCKVASCMKG